MLFRISPRLISMKFLRKNIPDLPKINLHEIPEKEYSGSPQD
jgi:hypothetical protein